MAQAGRTGEVTPGHEARAADAEAFATQAHETLASEWAVVGYFYAAYHTVRQALSVDPIFDDAQRCQALGLIPGDRDARSHHSSFRRGTRERIGVNDLVDKLYPTIASHYRVLHAASVDVRYEAGLNGPIREARSSWEFIKREGKAGRLVAR